MVAGCMHNLKLYRLSKAQSHGCPCLQFLPLRGFLCLITPGKSFDTSGIHRFTASLMSIDFDHFFKALSAII